MAQEDHHIDRFLDDLANRLAGAVAGPRFNSDEMRSAGRIIKGSFDKRSGDFEFLGHHRAAVLALCTLVAVDEFDN